MTQKGMTMKTLIAMAGTLLTLLALPHVAQGNSAARVDVLVYYTAAAAEHYDGEPGVRIRHLIAVANDVFERSGLQASLHLAGLELTNYGGAERAPMALQDITYGQDPAFAGVAGQRAAVGADVVLLMGTYLYDGYCGVAWQGGTEEAGRLSEADRAHAYAYVAIDCSVYTLVHELGHLLGLAHSHLETPEAGTRPWAVGHGVDGEFTTIMATPGAFNAPRLPYFSSPELMACLGHACGVAKDHPTGGAYAVKALQETLPQLAAYMTAHDDDQTVAAAVADTERQHLSAADGDGVMMSAPDADQAPDAGSAVVANSLQGKPKQAAPQESSASSPSGPAAAGSSSGTSAAPVASSSSVTGGQGAAGGGGCAAGSGHDDLSLPLLLLAALIGMLRRRKPLAARLLG